MRVDRFRFQIVSVFVKKVTSTPPPPFKNPSSLRVGGGGGEGKKMECPSSYFKIGCSTPIYSSSKAGFHRVSGLVFVFSDFLTEKTVQSIVEIDFSLNLVNGVKILPYFS